MGAGAVAARRPAPAQGVEPSFRSAEELREVLDRLLGEIDGDPAVGSRFRLSVVPHRFVFSDLGVVLNVARADSGPHDLRWSFAEGPDWSPAISLEMNSGVANRYLQGAENFGIALARGEIRVSCEHARSALAFLPASVELIDRYRRIVRRDYTHLVIDRHG